MEAVFEKKIVSSELSRMQEFVSFTKNVHKVAECKDDNCEIEKFINMIERKIFDEELSFDKRRLFFTNVALQQGSVFNAMFNLHWKGKENIDKIDGLVTRSRRTLEEQTTHYETFRKLTSEKYLIQKKIDAIIEKMYY